MRTASAPAAAPATEGGSFVQVSSQRSEADAQAAFRALRAKYPDVFGDHQPVIRRADLGDKGVFFRAQVGPFASIGQATEFCSSLKAAGGECVVQRN
jgi:cell division septation protein DedD